jgi:hypothetical protein
LKVGDWRRLGWVSPPHSIPAPSANLLKAAHDDAAAKKKPDSVRNFPVVSLVVLGSHRYFLERAIIITAIVVTGIVAAVTGYIVGYIEAENHYKIKYGERP